MKPFNLEEAKSGKPVCTRDGRPVRILCFDFITPENNPIIGLVKINEKQEGVLFYNLDGKCQNHDLDLMMVSEKREGWVNIYRYGDNDCTSNIIHKTFEDAYKNRNVDGYITTTKIEWEE